LKVHAPFALHVIVQLPSAQSDVHAVQSQIVFGGRLAAQVLPPVGGGGGGVPGGVPGGFAGGGVGVPPLLDGVPPSPPFCVTVVLHAPMQAKRQRPIARRMKRPPHDIEDHASCHPPTRRNAAESHEAPRQRRRVIAFVATARAPRLTRDRAISLAENGR
jgi:hypothetical protein